MLKNKVVLITGSSSGIGAATARIAVAQGAKVILHGKTEDDNLKAIAKELQAEYIVCDIRDKKAVDKTVADILKHFPKIDALCNVAGAINPKPFLETTDEDWLDAYSVNLLGTVHFCQVLIPHMQKNKFGRIVNIASVRAYSQGSLASRLPYCASKAGVVNITAGLAKEYAEDNILINSISPGGVNTAIAKIYGNGAIAKRNADVPLNRIAEPNEIGEMICFLISDKASYITGQDFLIDGGYTIGKK